MNTGSIEEAERSASWADAPVPAWTAWVCGILVVLTLFQIGCTSRGRKPEALPEPEDGGLHLPMTTTAPGTKPGSIEESTPTTEPPWPSVRDFDLLSATLQIRCPNPEGLTPVRLGEPPETEDGYTRVSINEIAYGDLTGDGQDEAAVSVNCWSPDNGGGWSDSVVVVRAGPDGPEQIAEPIDGHGPTFVDGTFILRRDVREANEKPWEATTTLFVPVRLVDGKFVDGAAGTPVTETTPMTGEGLGPLVIGSSYEEIAAASGQTIRFSTIFRGAHCGHLAIEGGDERISGMGTPDRLLAVTLRDGPYRTDSGFAIGSPTDELLDALGEPFITQETRFRPDLVNHLFLDQRNGNVTMYGVTAESVEYLGVGIRTWVDAEEGCV